MSKGTTRAKSLRIRPSQPRQKNWGHSIHSSGHSGTYVIEDSIVAMNVEVAKVPNMTGPAFRSTFARFVYQIRGDTLLLTRRTPRGAFTMQLIRAE
jgi:hypothetical protein